LSNLLYSQHHDAATKYAGIAFVASWIAQFVGHGKVSFFRHSLHSASLSSSRLIADTIGSDISANQFEGRAPALLDSLLQSLVLAVFFVWLEVLFYLGYRPALFKRLQNRTGVEVAKYRKEKAEKERRKVK
jgi:uncharacterized membrane protein YGL010W